MTADVRAGAAGVVVFSEVYDAGWNSYVDGEPVETLRVNHALRGVPVSAGEHAVELRYEPVALRAGLWISLGTIIALLSVWAAAIRRTLIDDRKNASGGEPGG